MSRPHVTVKLIVLLLSTGCEPSPTQSPPTPKIPVEARQDLPKLLEFMRSDNWRVRSEARQLMSELPASDSVANLVQLYRAKWDESAEERRLLIKALHVFKTDATESVAMLADDYCRQNGDAEGESAQLRQAVLDFLETPNPKAALFPHALRCHDHSSAVKAPSAEQRAWLRLVGQTAPLAEGALQHRENLEAVLIHHLRDTPADPRAVTALLPLTTWLVETMPANSETTALERTVTDARDALEERLDDLVADEPIAFRTTIIRRRPRRRSNPDHTRWSNEVRELRAIVEALSQLCDEPPRSDASVD